MTVAGMSGVAASSCRASGSNGVNEVGPVGRSYFGGRSKANARLTVDLPSPDPLRPAAAEHRPRPAAGSEPNPPLRSPIQSVWVASVPTVAMASFFKSRRQLVANSARCDQPSPRGQGGTGQRSASANVVPSGKYQRN